MSGRFLRDNAFLVAAVALPVVIVGLFLLTTAIPRWTVPPPAYDLLLRTSEYEQPNSAVFVDFVVRGERLHASIRRVDPNSYAPLAKLWLFDHATMNAREITLDLPRELAPGESTRMRRYGESVSLVNRGRVIRVRTSAPHSYQSPLFVGWLIDEGAR